MVRHAFWQGAAGVHSLDLEVRNEQHGLQAGLNLKPEPLPAVGQGKATKHRRSHVVGMAFCLRAEGKELLLVQRPPAEFIQPHQDAKPYRDAAAQTTGLRHIATDGPGERKRRGRDVPLLEEQGGNGLHHRVMRLNARRPFQPGHGDLIVKRERQAQTIIARTDVGRCGRHRDGDRRRHAA